MSDATIYSWLKQDRIDRGEAEGATTSQQLELAAARRRIKQLETELAVARKVSEVLLAEGVAPKALPGDRVSDRAGHQRAAGLHRAGGLAIGLLRLQGSPRCAAYAAPHLVGRRDRRRAQAVRRHRRRAAGDRRA